jgi:sterol 3beta-glucosyltransferase
MFRAVINRWRRETLQLPPHPFKGYRDRMEARKVTVLHGFSPHVVPRPRDWPNHIHDTGYWFPQDREWQPPKEIMAFLEAGAPPLFIGFGSMPIQHPQRTTEMILEALRQCGQRAVLHMGWGGLGTRALPATVFKMDYAPYEWLFPRMSMIIHHGGSGTTGFALRSGVPSCVVPFVFDQFYWGERTAQLGAGPRPIPFRKISVERLRRTIEMGVSSVQMKQAACELRQKIEGENGIAAAVHIIESLMMPD